MSDSRQLEREAEETRLQLTRTLGELRERITPGQLVDEAIEYARDSGGGEFVRNLGRQATANPLSICLIGAGIAWLALSSGRSEPAPYWLRGNANGNRRASPTPSSRAAYPQTRPNTGAEGRSAASERAAELNNSVGAAASSAGETAASTYETAKSGLASAADAIGDAAAAGYDAARSSAGVAVNAIGDAATAGYESARSSMGSAADAVTEATSDAVHSAGDAIGNGWDFLRRCAEEPAVVAGLGVAIGAALGAALPNSEFEDKLVGDTSERLKDQATDFAREQFERTKAKTKEVVQGAVHEAVDGAGDRLHAGLSNGSASVQNSATAGETVGAAEPSRRS